MKIYQTHINGRQEVARDTIEISLKRPAGFDFRAGQYLQLGVSRLLYPDPVGRSRVLSIASSPLNKKEICVTFRDTGSGFKRTLKALEIGDPVIIEGPYGFFTLTEKSSRPMVFIAGGIGITPFVSMIQYATAMALDVPITLLYANNSKESTAYLTKLRGLSRNNTNFKVKNTFDRIDKQFLFYNVSDPYESVWYISGPPGMVDHVRNLLFLSEIDEGMICFEAFTGYK